MAFSSTWWCLCLVCSLWLSFHLLWRLIYFEHLFQLIILELCDTSTYVRPEQLGSGDCYSNGPQVESKCVGEIRSVLWDRGWGWRGRHLWRVMRQGKWGQGQSRAFSSCGLIGAVRTVGPQSACHITWWIPGRGNQWGCPSLGRPTPMSLARFRKMICVNFSLCQRDFFLYRLSLRALADLLV